MSLIFIIGLSRSIYSLWQKGSLVTEQETQRKKLEAENQVLQRKLAEAQSSPFIEKQARERLNLQREGEVVVVLPKNLPTPQPQVVTLPVPSWQQWWKLFF